MILNRRRFVAGAGGLLTATAAGMAGIAGAAEIRRIGLQLYTVRDIFATDPIGTLQKVARVGYREVEFGGGDYDTMDHAMLRRAMDRLHLRAPSLHIPLEMMTKDFGAAVKMTRALGGETIVLPWLSDEYRSEARLGALIPELNKIAARAREAGLGFAYHNHDFEFLTRSQGTTLYDRLIADTDPALVKFELDLYWAIHAGADAKKLIDRLSTRLYAFHVKDMNRDGSMTAVGAGTIDFAALFRLPSAAHVQHFYVEDDEAPAPYIPDITTSYQTLRTLRF